MSNEKRNKKKNSKFDNKFVIRHCRNDMIRTKDDMVLLNNARSSVFNHTMSAARSVNDLDQLPPMSAHQLSQNTLPAYRYYYLHFGKI